MATKQEIVNEIFKFLGLDLNYNQLKYSMAIDLNKFKKIEYIFLLREIKSALA